MWEVLFPSTLAMEKSNCHLIIILKKNRLYLNFDCVEPMFTASHPFVDFAQNKTFCICQMLFISTHTHTAIVLHGKYDKPQTQTLAHPPTLKCQLNFYLFFDIAISGHRFATKLHFISNWIILGIWHSFESKKITTTFTENHRGRCQICKRRWCDRIYRRVYRHH